MAWHHYWHVALVQAVVMIVIPTCQQPPAELNSFPEKKYSDLLSQLHPTGYTNCSSVDYPNFNGCCEGTNAVCCNDMHHCCPENYVCNLHKGACTSMISTNNLKSTEKIELHSPYDIVCEDGTTRCPDKTTCCKLITGGYGCCEYPEGKCCEDKIHCCPRGYDCDPNSNKCTRGKSISHLLMVRPHKFFKSNLCPDGNTICKLNQTCCKQSNNTWACCPHPDSVCCVTYCCLNGQECDLIQNKCKMRRNIPYSKMQYVDLIQGTKITLNTKENKVESSIHCLNGKTVCSVNETCCGLGLEDYGCCPEREGTCCSDGEHCCPNSYKCLSNGKCVKRKY